MTAAEIERFTDNNRVVWALMSNGELTRTQRGKAIVFHRGLTVESFGRFKIAQLTEA